MIINNSFGWLKSICVALAIVSVPMSADYADKVKGSIAGGLVGDALGNVTEFVKSVDAMLKQYPGGITSYADFKKFNGTHGKMRRSSQGEYVPYTDDTAMARVTLDVLIQARRNNWDMNSTMATMARGYDADMRNKYKDIYGNTITAGWNEGFRAPGNCCKKNVAKVAVNKQVSSDWWRISTDASSDGGCGSVMRAHPFGLVYADNPDKAAEWSAEHSCITHCAPIAKAASAAFAKGVALAVKGEAHDTILATMVAAAEKYDVGTANMMRKALAYAKQNKQYAGNLSQLFKHSKPVFAEFQGWAAHEAIAAATYIFALVPNDAYKAVYLGVHTPGDSDSIASIAGALVGAYVGFDAVEKSWKDAGHQLEIEKFEGSETLTEKYPQELVNLSQQKQSTNTPQKNIAAYKPVVFDKKVNSTTWETCKWYAKRATIGLVFLGGLVWLCSE